MESDSTTIPVDQAPSNGRPVINNENIVVYVKDDAILEKICIDLQKPLQRGQYRVDISFFVAGKEII